MNVIVIGVDGAIGAAVARALEMRGGRVYGTTRRRGQTSDGVIYLDLNDPNAMESPLPGADVAIFCAALTRFADCRANPDMAERINASVPTGIAKRLVQRGTHVVLVSSSAVFDCREPHMAADRARAPTSVYGRTKAGAELAFLQFGTSASILRLSKVLTAAFPLFRGWMESLSHDQPVRAFSDLRISPIRLDDVVKALNSICVDRAGGIFQMSAADDISYVDAARHIALRLGKPSSLVEPCPAADFGIPEEEVTLFTSLDTSRLAAQYGFAPPQARAVIDAIFGLAVREASR